MGEADGFGSGSDGVDADDLDDAGRLPARVGTVRMQHRHACHAGPHDGASASPATTPMMRTLSPGPVPVACARRFSERCAGCGCAVAVMVEAAGPALTALGVDPAAGHMAGKEVRFGVALSSLFAW